MDFGHSWMLTQVILLIILMIILTTFTMCFSGGTVTLQSLSKAGFVLTSNVAWYCNWSGPKQRLWELGGRERRWNRNRRWGIRTALKNPSQVLTITMIMGVDAQGSPPGVAHLLKVILALLGYWLSSLFPSAPVTRVDALQAAFSALNCFILRKQNTTSDFTKCICEICR